MNESEFNVLVDDVMLKIEDCLDEESETDLDYMTVGGVLTVKCENGAQIIFTRQAPVSQLWVATPQGGFHFDYDVDTKTWLRDSDQQSFVPFLIATFSEVAGEQLGFDTLSD
ncbi:MAG: iron donor protein CyaY [Motiliproteus sp.]|nr:iron donor protein CyaY [Motiliproteus sp.]MCW9051439.1 iron donor protein CyaY [Motiliproteus sp.]